MATLPERKAFWGDEKLPKPLANRRMFSVPCLR